MATASEATKTKLEDSVSWFLADKMRDASTPIATKKYLTTSNVLVYLTRCTVAESTVPRLKVQIFERVSGGVREKGYLLFADHRLMKYVNEMIFGSKPGTATGNQQEEVSDEEAGQVVELVGSLANARQTL